MASLPQHICNNSLKFIFGQIQAVILVLWMLWCQSLIGQENPPILSYMPKQYDAQNQNWDIDQDVNGFIYIANNAGLLEFNGAQWQLYPMPKQTIVRSVLVHDQRIYSGSYMSFGYWTRSDTGSLEYTSLNETLNIQLEEDEEFWNITHVDGYILFQSRSRIYIVNPSDKSFEIISSEETITKILKCDERIYFQRLGKGLFLIDKGRDLLISDDDIVKNSPIVSIFQIVDSTLILTEKEGLFKLIDNSIIQTNLLDQQDLQELSFYCGISLSDGSLLLGSISNGLIQIDPATGKINRKIGRGNGLLNNTVLSLYQDRQNNIWAGLDYGINCITITSNLSAYKDNFGKLGTVYTSVIHEGYLYLGTNQGLFSKRIDETEDFKLIEGTNGQVWMLKVMNNSLFCGHDKGTFVIKDNEAKYIINGVEGSWDYKTIPSNPGLLLLGTYSGLFILEQNGERWDIRNKIEGFDISSRFFEIMGWDIFVNHEFKGLYHLKVDENLTRVIESVKIEEVGQESGSSIFKFSDELYYSSGSNIWKYTAEGGFAKDPDFSELFDPNSDLSSLFVVNHSTNILWRYSDDNILIIEPVSINAEPKLETIPLSVENRETVAGFGNMSKIGEDEFLIGTSEGYWVLNTEEQADSSIPEIQITSVKSRSFDAPFSALPLTLTEDISVPNNSNNLFFQYSIPYFQSTIHTEYQFQLEGLNSSWSEWSANSSYLFENLPYGEYTFQVRGRIGSVVSPNIASYDFDIERPWILSTGMIVLYAIIFLSFLAIIHVIYRNYYKRQREKILMASQKELQLKELENERVRMQFENERLAQNIENKNRELAIGTMSLIKKNEFLNTIKERISKASEPSDYNEVIRVIDKNLNNQDDWKLFKEAFNNADKDFLKKVKSKHPMLTPNDLKLCAYLRLNLSSKEIAPLLNISSRSVEVKRYRLRKKMNLEHTVSLTNYILEI